MAYRNCFKKPNDNLNSGQYISRKKSRTIFKASVDLANNGGVYHKKTESGQDMGTYVGDVNISRDGKKCLIGATSYDTLLSVTNGKYLEQPTTFDFPDSEDLWTGSIYKIDLSGVVSIISYPDGSANTFSYPPFILANQLYPKLNPPSDQGLIVDPCYNLFYPNDIGTDRNDHSACYINDERAYEQYRKRIPLTETYVKNYIGAKNGFVGNYYYPAPFTFDCCNNYVASITETTNRSLRIIPVVPAVPAVPVVPVPDPSEIQFAQYLNTTVIYQTDGDNDYYRIAFTNVNNTTINYLNSLNNIGGNMLTLTYKIDNNVQYTYSGLLIDPSAIFMNDSGIIGFNFISTPTLVDLSAQGVPLIISNVYTQQTIGMIESNSNIWIMTYSEPINMLKQNINHYQISNNRFLCKLPYSFVINNISDLSNIHTQAANTVGIIFIDTTTNAFYILYYTGNETINLNNVSPNTITNVHIDNMSFVLKYVDYNISQSAYEYTITSYTHDL